MLSDFQPSASSPFDSLPNEIVLKIMQYLDRTSLKEALQVDKRFYRLISQSTKIMPALPLTVGLFKGPANRDIEQFDRRYKEIVFKNIEEKKWFKYVKVALKKIGSDVVKVDFRDCQFPANGLFEVLSCFPSVEKVMLISMGKLMDTANQQVLDPDLFPQLKDVQVEFVKSVSQHFIESLSVIIHF